MQWTDEKNRCRWANPKNERYIRYHDEEWGVPLHDDHKLFEMLILECFQAGLSWECIPLIQDAFREAFDDFDLDAVCAYGEDKLEELQVVRAFYDQWCRLQGEVESCYHDKPREKKSCPRRRSSGRSRTPSFVRRSISA